RKMNGKPSMKAAELCRWMPVYADERRHPAKRKAPTNAVGKEFGCKKFGGGAVCVIDGFVFRACIKYPSPERGLHPFGREKRHRPIARDVGRPFLIGKADSLDIADQPGGADAAGGGTQIRDGERAGARPRPFLIELLQHEL